MFALANCATRAKILCFTGFFLSLVEFASYVFGNDRDQIPVPARP